MDSAGSGKVPFMVTCKHESKTPDSIKIMKGHEEKNEQSLSRNTLFRRITL
jgi:hypothetical protein